MVSGQYEPAIERVETGVRAVPGRRRYKGASEPAPAYVSLTHRQRSTTNAGIGECRYLLARALSSRHASRHVPLTSVSSMC